MLSVVGLFSGRYSKYLLLCGLALAVYLWISSIYNGFIKTKQDLAVAIAEQQKQRDINLQVKRDASIFKGIFDDHDGTIADESERLLNEYRGKFVRTASQTDTRNSNDRLQGIVSNPRPATNRGKDNPLVAETRLREADHFTADDLKAIAQILSEEPDDVE